MIVGKNFRFYAGHRNLDLTGKCSRLHGHTYHVECGFEMKVVGGITMVFEDIEKLVEPIIKELDHRFLVHDKDPLANVLREANEEFFEVPFSTSVENLAEYLFERIRKEAGLPIVNLTLRETTTSWITVSKPI